MSCIIQIRIDYEYIIKEIENYSFTSYVYIIK